MVSEKNNRISVIINTYNASEHLAEVLESVRGFDETVVVDMESTDSTVSLAREHGARVLTFPRGEANICEAARDFAIHSAANPWVLVVDADETVPAALRDFLYRWVENNSRPEAPAALLIPRKNMFMGRPATGSPDYQLRFMRHARAKWPAVIHARPQIDGKIGRLPARRKDLYLRHLDDARLSDRFAKQNRYSDNEVPKRLRRRFGAAALLLRPGWFFLRSWLFNGGFRDGRRGIINAWMAATYQIQLMAKATEAQMLRDDEKA